MSERRYIVKVTSEILGNSVDLMTKSRIKNFNKVAFMLSEKVDETGIAQSFGMWTVEPNEIHEVEMADERLL